MNHLTWNDLFELIDEPAGSPRRAELERHVAACRRCRALLETQRSFERLARTIAAPEPSPGFTSRIVSAVQGSQTEGRFFRLLMILGAGIPLALVGVLIGYAVYFSASTPSDGGSDLFGGALNNTGGTLERIQSALTSALGDTGSTIVTIVQTDVLSIAALTVVSVFLLTIADRLLLRRILRSRM